MLKTSLSELESVLIAVKNNNQDELVVTLFEGLLLHVWEKDEDDKIIQEWAAEMICELNLEENKEMVKVVRSVEDNLLDYFTTRFKEVREAYARTCRACRSELDEDGTCPTCIEKAHEEALAENTKRG